MRAKRCYDQYGREVDPRPIIRPCQVRKPKESKPDECFHGNLNPNPVDPDPVDPDPDPTKCCSTPPVVECCDPDTGIDLFPSPINDCPEGFSLLGAGADENKEFTVLAPSDFYEITVAGTILDCVELDGCFAVNAPNVTIMNSKINCDATPWGIRQLPGATGLKVIGNTITGGPAGSAAGVFLVEDAIVTNNDISGGYDGIQSIGSNIVIADNYIHDFFVTPTSHNDGIQIMEGDDITIERNCIVGGAPSPSVNSAIFVQPETGDITNIDINNNYLSGFGFTVRYNNNKGFIVDGIIVDNTFGTTPMPQFGPIGVTGGATAVVTCNIWESGAVIISGGNVCAGNGPVPILFEDKLICKGSV